MGNFACMKEEMKPVPLEFRHRIVEQFGAGIGEALLQALDEEPSVSLRMNSLKLPDAGSPYPGSRPVGWAPGGWWLPERPRFTHHPWLHGGGFYVQEAASMYISELASHIAREEGRKDLRVLDLCAAPGGKSIGVAEALGPEALIVSNEVDGRRASVLKENMVKWGHPGSIVTSGSAADWGKAGGWFDVMVADVPCSGEGMMRKEPVARSQWSPRLVGQCASLQREILRDSLSALKPGGWLIYSTCTFNPAENEENVEWLCREHDVELCGRPRRFIPGRDGGEGLFMALLRKSGGGDGELSVAGRKNGERKAAKVKNKADVGMISEAKGWISSGNWDWDFDGERLTAIPAAGKDLMGFLPGGIRILKPGIGIASVKGRDLVPSHQLAVSAVFRNGVFPEVELGLEESLRYLRREAIVLPEGSPKGYVVVSYRGVRLGFVKNLGPRSNNLYPKEWRILTL